MKLKNFFANVALVLSISSLMAFTISSCDGASNPAEKFKVEFMVQGGNGTLSAKVGTENFTGGMVVGGTIINFVAEGSASYEVDKWMINGVDQTPTSEKTKFNLTVKEHTVVLVSFKAEGSTPSNNVKVTFSFGSGNITAKVNGNEIQSGNFVPKGTTVDFEVTLRAGLVHYEIDKWMVNGVDKTPTTDKTKLQLVVNGETTIVVSAKLKQYSVEFSSNDTAKGTVTAKDEDANDLITGNKVDALKNVTFKATALSGATFQKWTVNGEDQTAGGDPTTLTIAIKANTTVQAVFN